jgi:hypothetical protein
VAENLFACNELRRSEILGMEELATRKGRMKVVTLVVWMRHDACACVRFL